MTCALAVATEKNLLFPIYLEDSEIMNCRPETSPSSIKAVINTRTVTTMQRNVPYINVLAKTRSRFNSYTGISNTEKTFYNILVPPIIQQQPLPLVP